MGYHSEEKGVRGEALTVLTPWDKVFLSFGSVFFIFAFKKKENEPGYRGRAPL
jgi:hypothetical protein